MSAHSQKWKKHGYYWVHISTMGIYLLVPIALVINSAKWIMVFASLWVFFLLMIWLQILVWNTKVHLSSLVDNFTRITKHPVWAAEVFEHVQTWDLYLKGKKDCWWLWTSLVWKSSILLVSSGFKIMLVQLKLFGLCLVHVRSFFQMFIQPCTFQSAAAIICTYMERVVSWAGETS